MKLAVIYNSSINNLHIKVSAHPLNKRKVRKVIAGLEIGQPDNARVVPPKQTLSDPTHIRCDQDLYAFLHLMDTKPIMVLMNPHRLAQDVHNIPALADAIAGTLYFPFGNFNGPKYYVDSVQYSNAIVQRRVGVKTGVSLEDHKFKERLEDIWHWI